MRIAAETVVGAAPGALAHESDGMHVCWRGFAFAPGHSSGAASIERFASRAARDGVAAASTELHGLYLAAVEDPGSRATYAFVDRSGMYHAYWSADGAAADFLALARGGSADLDPEAVAELILQGHVAFGRTPVPHIRRIFAREVVVLPWDESRPYGVPRPLPALWEPPPADLPAQLEALVPALAGRRISVDLTGGGDTRLIAVALASLGVPFETVTSGAPGGEEATIAALVAQRLGREHHIVPHRPEALAGELDDLLLGSGCLVDPLLSHRELQLQRSRTERGIELVLHGVGGELFKDHFWLQDFPRYRSPNADLERFWDLRYRRAQRGPAPLAGEYAAAAAGFRAHHLEQFARYRRPLNTDTYDATAFYVRLPDVGGRSLTNRSRVIPTYAPMMDLDACRAGYALPRRMRAFQRYHRELITGLAPEIARIRSTEGGLTMSVAPRAVARDAVRWPADKAMRAVQKRLPAARRRPALESPLPPLYATLRTLPVLAASVERLTAAGILQPGTTAEQLSDGHLGGVLAVARLLEELS